MLQINVAKDVDDGDEGAIGVLFELGHFIAVEDVSGRYEPEKHAHPMETNDQENPVAVDRSVDCKSHDAGRDGAQPPEELEDDSEPSEDELVDILAADVFVERRQGPADAHQRQDGGHDVQILDVTRMWFEPDQIELNEEHGRRFYKGVR